MGRVRYIVEALQELGAVELAVGVLVTEAEHIGRLIEGVRSDDGSPISAELGKVDAAIAIRAGQQREIEPGKRQQHGGLSSQGGAWIR